MGQTAGQPWADGISAFTTLGIPPIEFGPGAFASLADRLPRFGRSLLLVRGERSFQRLEQARWLEALLGRLEVARQDVVVSGEPGPALVDEAVARFRPARIDVVLAIGGGSVIDAGKAIAALLPSGDSVWEYLEEVGRGRTFEGVGCPIIAIPTTAGTGSEVTRNAVLSVPGPRGFKRSFRADALVPRLAIVDPDLLATCPRPLIAADGLDALTQLIEAYTSRRANPISDAIARRGLQASRDGLARWYDGAPADQARARADAAFAALASGIALAQAGLGAVHGLAAAIGGLYAVPHGVVCGVLLAPTTRVNLATLHARTPDAPALARYAQVACTLLPDRAAGDPGVLDDLPALLQDLTVHLGMRGLAEWGVAARDIPRLIELSRAGSMRTNPVDLTDEELTGILHSAL
ncbi:MAG: iron-containing alcohol dehydrogenase [Candidatus Limnocylindrales bacterium]